MTDLSTTFHGSSEGCEPSVTSALLPGLFLGLLGGILVTWLVMSSSALPMSAPPAAPHAPGLPDWHGNVMRSGPAE